MSDVMQLQMLNTISNRIFEVLESIRDILSNAFGIDAGPTPDPGASVATPEKALTKSFNKIGKTIGSIFKSTLGKFALIGKILQGLMEPFELITDPLALFGEIMSQILYPILEPFSDLLYSAAEGLQEIMDRLEPFYPIITEIVKTILDLLINNVLATIMFVYNTVVSIINYVKSQIDVFLQFIRGEITFGEFIANLWQNVLSLLNGLLGNLITWVRSIWDKIWSALGEIITKLGEWIRGIWNRITGALEDFLLKLIQWFRDMPDRVIGGITDVGADIADWWGGLW